MIFNWTPNFVPNKIVIFGCGGTGSRVVPLVAQFVKSCAWVINPELILVDFDAVEEKNLLRQNFISSDVGKNKAVVLASRYSKAFGISILPIIQRLFVSNVKTNLQIEAYQDYDRIIYNNERKNIIYIMCVDSPEARREILHLIITTGGAAINNILIDAGNENDFGQIVVSSLFTMD
jgi:tRNA A37 threonylcarbamoyladenosine dehydratase